MAVFQFLRISFVLNGAHCLTLKKICKADQILKQGMLHLFHVLTSITKVAVSVSEKIILYA